MEIAFIPKWLIKLFASEYKIQHELNILISNTLIILLFLILKSNLIYLLNLIPHFCLFDKIIGVECPVCGTTRAFCEISNGNFKNAYTLNLSSLFVVLYFVFQIPLRITTLIKNKFIYKVNKISKIMSFFVLVIIIVNWLINLTIDY